VLASGPLLRRFVASMELAALGQGILALLCSDRGLPELPPHFSAVRLNEEIS